MFHIVHVLNNKFFTKPILAIPCPSRVQKGSSSGREHHLSSIYLSMLPLQPRLQQVISLLLFYFSLATST